MSMGNGLAGFNGHGREIPEQLRRVHLVQVRPRPLRFKHDDRLAVLQDGVVYLFAFPGAGVGR